MSVSLLGMPVNCPEPSKLSGEFMRSFNFAKYQSRFEEEVICKGVEKGLIGKLHQVNVRMGKFAYTKYARVVGEKINCDIPFALDYYGYLKRSTGFLDIIEDREPLRQVKSIQTTVVFFASLKIEEIACITMDQYLRGGFSEFKKEVLYWRGFEQKGKTKTLEKPILRGEDRIAGV